MRIDSALRAELLDVYAHYAHSIDDGDAIAWAECFTPDGVLWSSRGFEVAGREALRLFAESRHRERPAPERHASWHHLFTRTGDGVVGRCSAAILRTTPGAVEVVFAATYRDLLVPSTSGWMISRRDVHIDEP